MKQPKQLHIFTWEDMNIYHNLPLRLPALLQGTERDLRELVWQLNSLAATAIRAAPQSVPLNASPSPARPLPWVATLDLGWAHDSDYTFLYSPAALGRTLDEHNKEDQMVVMEVVLAQWNDKLQKQYSTSGDMEASFFVPIWAQSCEEWELSAQDLYEHWAAQRQQDRIGAQVERLADADNKNGKIKSKI